MRCGGNIPEFNWTSPCPWHSALIQAEHQDSSYNAVPKSTVLMSKPIEAKTLKQICDLCMCRTWRQRHLNRSLTPLVLPLIGHRRAASASSVWRCAIGLSYPWHWRTSPSVFSLRRKWASSVGLAQVCMRVSVCLERSFEMLNCGKQTSLEDAPSLIWVASPLRWPFFCVTDLSTALDLSTVCFD